MKYNDPNYDPMQKIRQSDAIAITAVMAGMIGGLLAACIIWMMYGG